MCISSHDRKKFVLFSQKHSISSAIVYRFIHWQLSFLQRICAEVIVQSHLPSALIVLLLEANGPVIEACVKAVVHAEDNWPAQDHPWRATTYNRAQEGLAASQR